MKSFLDQLFESARIDTVLRDRIKRTREKIISFSIYTDCPEMLDKLFGLYKKVSLDTLDEYMRMAEKSPQCMAFLLGYKNSNYTQKQQHRAKRVKEKKLLGEIKCSVSEWKKVFSFEYTVTGIVIRGYMGEDTDVVIPEKIGNCRVTTVGYGAFNERPDITSVVFPESVKRVTEYSFENCENITDVIFLNPDTYIDLLAFYGNPNITVHAPSGGEVEFYARDEKLNFVPL